MTDISPLLIEILVSLRSRMRKRGDFETADWIRDALNKLGIVLEDTERLNATRPDNQND